MTVTGGRGRKTSGRGKAKKKKKIQTQNPNLKPNPNSYQHLNTQEELFTLLTNSITTVQAFLYQNDLVLTPSQTLTLESLISSTLFSLHRAFKPLTSPSSLPFPQPPQSLSEQCWFSRFLSATASNCYDPRWSLAFRMSEPSFTLLLRLLTPALNDSIPSIPSNFALAAAIYRLAHGASYKAVARRFGIESTDACRAFFAVCKAVNEKLGHFFEFWSDKVRVLEGFEWISLPNCCGVLGFGSFGIDGELLGKKGSLLVQALVDSEGRFLDVSAGWPSTLTPESILRQSKLYLGIEESGELVNGALHELGDGNSIPPYVLGDSCFPLLPWLLTPYIRSTDEEGSFGSMERAFNSAHIRAMGLVHTAFGRVRARWQLLSKPWKQDCVEFLPYVVVTSCLLHNFVIKCKEPMSDEKVGFLKEEETLPVFDGGMNESGKRIRDVLALHLCRVSLRR